MFFKLAKKLFNRNKRQAVTRKTAVKAMLNKIDRDVALADFEIAQAQIRRSA